VSADDLVLRAPAPPASADIAKPYEPTPSERETLKSYFARRDKRKPAPRMKVKADAKGVVNVEFHHPDRSIGQWLLMDAIGTADSEFMDGLLKQLVNAGTQGRTVDENGVTFMLSIVKGIEPRDQVETMLAAQMAAVHNATMTFARRLAHVDNIPQQDSAERAFKQARQDVRGASLGFEGISIQGRAENDNSARQRRRRRPSGNWHGQFPWEGGGRKNRRTTPCSWICTGRPDAEGSRGGAGYSAARRPCGGIASAECTVPVGAHQRAIETP
jgi:hypothetical protein